MGSGFGTAALVLGILAIVFSIIPIAGFIAFLPGPLAIIFGVIGLTRKFSKKGTSAAGLILGVLSVIVAIIVTAIIGAAAQSVGRRSAHDRTPRRRSVAEGFSLLEGSNSRLDGPVSSCPQLFPPPAGTSRIGTDRRRRDPPR